jgi:hypothetical protein
VQQTRVCVLKVILESAHKIEFVVKYFQVCDGVLLWQSYFAFLVGCLTQRAPDVWESARFTSIFLASSFFCSQTESTPAHTQVTQTVGRQEENANDLFEGEGVLSQPARTHCAAGRNRKCPQDMTAAQSVLRAGWFTGSTTIAAHTLYRSRKSSKS